MSSQGGGHPIPPVPSSPPSSGGVRRHHTISASSRTARASARDPISEETQEQQLWNDDEVVDQDWVGPVGAVGEKSSLHRQSSLPTRYHRGFHGQASKTGNLTPKTMNSLTAIAGHEGDEDDWEREVRGLTVDDDEQHSLSNAEHPQHQQVMDAHSQGSSQSPLSPHFGPSHVPSPPPAASGVRRHVSLTYGAGAAGPRKSSSGLKRSGTLQAQVQHSTVPQSPSPPNADEDYADESYPYEDEYFTQQGQGQGQYPTSPIGRSSPWNAQGNEWRTPGGSGFSTSTNNSAGNSTIDDVQRALSSLEIASNNQNQMYQQSQNNNYQPGQSAHPPRFNPSHPPPAQAPGIRNGGNGNGNGGNGNGNGGNGSSSSRKLQLVTDFDGRQTPSSQSGHGGPVSASAYVPPIGGSGHNIQQQHQHQQHQQQYQQQRGTGGLDRDDRAQTASSGNSWDQKDRILGGRSSNPNLQYGYQQGGGKGGNGGVPNVPPIPQQYLQQQQQQRLASFGQGGNGGQGQGAGQGAGGSGQPPQGFINSPIDVPSLIAAKGYNPSNFDIRPQFARFFVIKSYTEDDVHKSLKYEIWSSTDPGNKRLDKAFKECAGRGPIYLFFSVNASGHFCGMAEMLTPVDYTRSSTVWASDKWKGVFKVRWIFVRDIPNVNLRHIKLNNTQERKPVTNSRDTQELLPDAGQEMLRIFHTHPARTSLLQDFAFYELQAMQKMQQPGASSPVHSPVPASMSPQLQPVSPVSQPQQNPFAMQNPNALAYQMPQMTPMMQMQMNMGMNMGMGGSQFGIPQAQAMHQSVMRHPSPGPAGPLPVGHGGQGFMGMPGF